MKAVPGPMPRTKEWYALRKFDPDRQRRPVVFGATDAAPACGVSPYATPLDLFCKKLGLSEEAEPTDAMMRGIDFEPVVLNIYERTRKVKLVRDLPMYLSTDYWWMGATPDGLKMNDSDEAPEWGVDAKTTTFRRFDKEGGDELKFGLEGTDQVPVDILFQAQQQCDVLELPFVEFPVLFSRDYIPIYRVERNEELIQIIRKGEKEMVERLANNDPPEPNWTHENTRELIGLLFGMKKGKSIEATDEQVAQWEAVKRRKARIKTLEERNQADLNKVLFAMQDAATAALPGQRVIKRIVVKETVVPEHVRQGYEFLRETKGE